VDVSVAGRVAGVEEGRAVREAVLTGAGMAGVSRVAEAEDVMDGIAEKVAVDSITVTGVGGVSPVCIPIQFPKSV
jgi:hypothetical protein